jgi:hypothetical protein
MEKLDIKCIQTNSGLQTMKVTGFSEEELYALKKMSHSEAREKLLEMLDERNGNTGTCWKCGYGVYGIWFDNEAAYVNIGSSCD